MEDQVKHVASGRVISQARTEILKLIELALKKQLRNSKGDCISLPTNPENYLSYCETVEVSAHPEQKTWFTFVLNDLNEDDDFHNSEGEVPLIDIRKLIKKNLSENRVPSVQMEIRVLKDIEMVMFRIATTSKTKNKEKDQARLLTAKPTFLVYFPGEPYFYANSVNPKEEHCVALMQALKCTAYEGIHYINIHLYV